MTIRYIKRAIETVLKQAVREFPAVVLTGPWQSGKTTVLKHLFGDRYRYVSLEPPDIRAAATADPRGFLSLYPPPVIFDEIQYVPELLPYIKVSHGYVIHPGDIRLPLAPGVSALPFAEL